MLFYIILVVLFIILIVLSYFTIKPMFKDEYIVLDGKKRYDLYQKENGHFSYIKF